jgi:hypothetical protein
MKKILMIISLSFVLLGCKNWSGRSDLPVITLEENSALVDPERTSTPTATPQTTTVPIETTLFTQTPIPTIGAAENAEVILQLLQNNAGCELPCWWGIIPGKTTWQGAEEYLHSLDYAQSPRVGYFPNEDNKFLVEVQLAVPKSIWPYYYTHIYYVFDEVIQVIDVIPGNDIQTFSFLNLLKAKGLPKNFLFNTWFEMREDDFAFPVYLFYPDAGALAYFVFEAVVTSNGVRACLSDDPVVHILLWNPELDYSFSEAFDYRRGIGDPDYVELTDLKEFMPEIGQQISNYILTNEAVCVETPREIWISLSE